MASWFWGREHLFGTSGLPWCWGAYPYPFGEVGGPVAAGVAGPVDGGLDVDAEQAGQYREGQVGCPCGGRGVAGLPGLDSVLAESAGQGLGYDGPWGRAGGVGRHNRPLQEVRWTSRGPFLYLRYICSVRG